LPKWRHAYKCDI